MNAVARYLRFNTRLTKKANMELHSLPPNRRFSTFNVFAASTALANKHKSVNLGQGFPSFETPDFVKRCASEAIFANQNQYSRPGGHPTFVETLSEMYTPLYGRSLDPLKEIVSCNGAQEGIFNIVVTFCEPSDEVICVEPYFDVYRKCVEMIGAKVVGVPLRLSSADATSSSSFTLDVSELEQKITDKTKLIILNTPHNPTGKVFSLSELEEIAKVVRKYPDVLILSDEVYEFMTFDGLKHERFALLDGMFERTLSLFSAGKTFSCTGWRIGYCIGPQHLIEPLINTQGVVAFCSATPLELGISNAFKIAQENNYFEDLAALLQTKRDNLCRALSNAGMKPIVPQGGYFVMADTSKINPGVSGVGGPRDFQVNQHLTEVVGVTGIPTSGFYAEENMHLSDNMLRFAYCKTDEEITEAEQRLNKS